MVWLLLSDDFAEDVARVELSDAAFRTHVEGLLWTMRRLTDGRIGPRELRRLAETEDPQAAVRELVAAGFWTGLPDGGFQIQHAMEHQPEAEVVETRRRQNAERQARHRRKKAGLPAADEAEDGVTGPVTRDTTRDRTRDAPSDSTRYPGRAGQGRAGPGREEVPPPPATWPEVVKPPAVTSSPLSAVSDDRPVELCEICRDEPVHGLVTNPETGQLRPCSGVVHRSSRSGRVA